MFKSNTLINPGNSAPRSVLETNICFLSLVKAQDIDAMFIFITLPKSINLLCYGCSKTILCSNVISFYIEKNRNMITK